jgi:transcriptional regulator with XRE-family HTH domain
MAEASPGANIGRNVRAVRERKLFSRTDLAERSGVSLAGIDHLERGLSARPRRRTIEKLADALDVDVDILMAETASPLAEAPPLQDRLFNGGSKERDAFIERCKRYVAARVAHYENRLAESSGVFADYVGVKALRDEAFEEFSRLIDLQGGELTERWLDDPEVPEVVKEDLGFALVEAQKPFVQVVGRIGDREVELAPTPYEKDEAERRHGELDVLAERRRQKEARRDHKSKTA